MAFDHGKYNDQSVTPKNNLLFNDIPYGPPFESLEEDNYLGQKINLELKCNKHHVNNKVCQMYDNIFLRMAISIPDLRSENDFKISDQTISAL